MGQEGRISEWNEGAFKSARLNEIQERLNFFKSNLLGITEGKFNYLHWITCADLLCDEGFSKYSVKERKEILKYKELIEKALEIMPPTMFVNDETVQGRKKSYLVDEQRMKFIKELVWDYEMTVRDYNDAHGLTTMNKEDDLDDWS